MGADGDDPAYYAMNSLSGEFGAWGDGVRLQHAYRELFRGYLNSSYVSIILFCPAHCAVIVRG